MKKVLIFILIAFNLYANEFEINSIDKNSAFIKCSGLKVGESGIVVKSFGEFSSIVSNAIVTKIENENCKIEFKEFEALSQKALPNLKESPKIGDKVIFHSLNNRALAITPNLKTYEKITNKDGITWLHPDIFVAYLESERTPAPTKENFREFCNTNSIGLLYFAIDKEYIVDCLSFKILQINELDTKNEQEIKPFYSRIGELKSSMFSFKKEMQNYKNYYLDLLK